MCLQPALQRPVNEAICASRFSLTHDVRRSHCLALPRSELAASLCHSSCDTFSATLRHAATQNGHELGLRVGIQLFGSIKDFIKSCLLTHRASCKHLTI